MEAEAVDTGTKRLRATKRLVIVADNSLIVGAIKTGFRDNGGFNLLGYVDARRTSVSTILEAKPDVVLIDDMDHADEAIEFIRELHESNDDIAIMVLTVHMQGSWLDRAFKAGARGAISKAIHPLALATLVHETLSGNLVHAPRNLVDQTNQVVGAVHDHPLTPRELEILHLVAGGQTNGEIARQLWVTEQTVKFHVSNIYRKLDVGNRTEACHYAHVHGMLQQPLVAAEEPVRVAS
jgi:DNA-binding NarL/FixJ family response regulator